MGFLHDVFSVFKFFFGLGALFALLGIGIALGWFALRFIVQRLLRGQPAERYAGLRKLFLSPEWDAL
jgi:hypothetical protein